jgi:hypothetical protein
MRRRSVRCLLIGRGVRIDCRFQARHAHAWTPGLDRQSRVCQVGGRPTDFEAGPASFSEIAREAGMPPTECIGILQAYPCRLGCAKSTICPLRLGPSECFARRRRPRHHNDVVARHPESIGLARPAQRG